MITVAGSIPAAVTNNDSATGRPLTLMLLQQVYISDGVSVTSQHVVKSKVHGFLVFPIFYYYKRDGAVINARSEWLLLDRDWKALLF
jgi:hypothetical protein